MNFYQVFLSNIPPDFTGQIGLRKMTDFDSVEIQAEMIEALIDKDGGSPFSPSGLGTSWAWLAGYGVEVWGYFDAAWPHPPYNQLSASREHYNDAYWLRKIHTGKLHENAYWTYPSNDPDRPYTNAANVWYQDWVVDLLLSTGIKRWRFDDGQLFRKSDAVNAGWFAIYDRLREAGCKVVVNGAWNIADPHAADWVYPAIEHVDGCMVELWCSHYTGQSTDSGWWELSDKSFKRLSKDWSSAGKDVVMLVRYRDGETIYDNYDSFMQHYVDLACEVDAIVAPAEYDYRRSAWRDWFANYQVIKTFEEELMQAADARQCISGNWGAALQKVIVADGYFPVETEFQWRFENIEYMVQKAEDKDKYAPRVYYAKMGDWGNIEKIDYPPK